MMWKPHMGLVAEKEPELITPLSKIGDLFGEPPQPNISINVVNQGQAKNVRTTGMQKHGDDWVIGVIMDDLENGGRLSEVLR